MSGLQPDRTFDWPGSRQFYLTVDFECDYGTALAPNRYEAVQRVGELVETLEEYDVPATVFVQTAVLDEEPETVDALRNADVPVEFHPHSHTHAPRSETTVADEVATSTERYRSFFGRDPVGYRFPNGEVRTEDFDPLAAAGYEFDASVFPSWRPGHFDNTDAPTSPLHVAGAPLYEIPFTVLSDRVRVPTSLSYCRLLGRPFLTALGRWPPSTVVFNVHMHDLFTPSTYDDLPPFYRAVYARNPDGFGLLESVLDRFSTAGYTFERYATLLERLDAAATG